MFSVVTDQASKASSTTPSKYVLKLVTISSFNRFSVLEKCEIRSVSLLVVELQDVPHLSVL